MVDDATEEILQAIHAFSAKVDERFDDVNGRIDEVHGRLHEEAVERRKLDASLRDFVDRRIEQSEERLVREIRRVDAKVDKLVDVLEDRDVISAKDAAIVAVAQQ